MGELTRSIADFLCSMPDRPLPDGAAEVVGIGFCDAIGVMIAGCGEPVHIAALTAMRARQSRPESRIALGPERCIAPDAAMVGAVAAHALDYDDYAYSNHVSAILVPAILAEAEHLGADGDAMLRAYVAGYEVWRTLMKREPDDFYERGWHPTAVLGGFGVVAAMSVLHRLTRDQIVNALGLAVAHGGGVMGNFGSMAKPFQGGHAAQGGMSSVRLALAGMDAGPDALDGANGFLRALSPHQRIDTATPADMLGHDWGIIDERLNIKRYPTVGSSQRSADCATRLHHDHAPDIDAIERVCAHISEKHIRVMPIHAPRTALEAKFSLEFVVAAGLISGEVGFDQLTDAYVQRPDVQRLIARVEPVVGPDDDPEFLAGARADIIHLHMRDGSVLSSPEVTRWRGHARNPMTTGELKAKFMDCSARRIGETEASALFDRLQNIRGLRTVADLPVIAPA
ncbi:MmgE/PrpD family protein [Microbulbifer sp. S227A]|uniref:MmgE/PrpD family protein n=1 Tax=Microbulbifer sp. S227A TaxID=3415131 RepID=UPI003C7A5D96